MNQLITYTKVKSIKLGEHVLALVGQEYVFCMFTREEYLAQGFDNIIWIGIDTSICILIYLDRVQEGYVLDTPPHALFCLHTT